MIVSTLIVSAALLLAVAFSLAWLLAPSLRRQIEQPKHWFQNQARRYDQACSPTRNDRTHPDEHS